MTPPLINALWCTHFLPYMGHENMCTPKFDARTCVHVREPYNTSQLGEKSVVIILSVKWQNTQ
jgi:hypothetical protein